MMKILRHIMMVLPLLLWASCSKQAVVVPECVSVSFSVNTDDTKAAGAANVDRCVFQVWMQDGDNYSLYNTVVKTDFNPGDCLVVSLMPKEHYRITAWVDHNGCYNVDNGIATIIQSPSFDAECYDAFYACVELDVTGDDAVAPIDLNATRPLACLRLQADDLDSFAVSEVSLSYSAPQGMNLLTGEVSADTEIQTPAGPVADVASKTIAVAYIFVGTETTGSVTLNCKRDDAPFTRTFDLIPLRRNYTTNIKGTLLTD